MIDIRKAADTLRSRLPGQPGYALVLGSGLGHLASELTGAVRVPFEELPGLPAAGVVGHAGAFDGGSLGGAEILVQAGRYHAYEGHSMDVVAAPARIAIALGVRVLIVTNAAGGLRTGLEPGDLVLLHDHINLMGRSPLVGPAREGEARFPDMTEPYDAGLREAARRAAATEGVELKPGVYAGVLGPAFETAAEVRMLAAMGADVVGMSTVPEVLVARAAGVSCLGFSVVTNLATGLAEAPIDHHEVLRIGEEAGRRLGRVLIRVLDERAASDQRADTK